MVRTPLGVGLPGYLRLLLQKDYSRPFRVRQTEVILGVSSAIELWRGETYETKEPETLDWIDGFAATDVFFDVGANVGLYSLYAARARGCRVFSFEPEGKNFARLARNQALNGLSQMLAYCTAVGGSMRLDRLFVAGTTAGDSQHNIGQTNVLFPRDCATVQGSVVVSLDDLCFTLGLPVPQHLKIDVDGLEEEIVSGAAKLLRHPDLRTVMIEIAELKGQRSVIYGQMEAAGLEAIGKAKRAYETDSVAARNILFGRKGGKVGDPNG
jgi:FkbM family methyltransferase